MKHQKHAKLAQPNVGDFGRNEWAILGTTCENIQKLARELSEILSPNSKMAYVDADHQAGDLGENLPFSTEFTDKIQYSRLDFQGKMTPFQSRAAHQPARHTMSPTASTHACFVLHRQRLLCSA